MADEPDKRNDDKVSQARFRSDRMFQDGDSWFFFTREGTIEGPFLVSSIEYSGSHNGEATYEMSLTSAGEITFVAFP